MQNKFGAEFVQKCIPDHLLFLSYLYSIMLYNTLVRDVW